jgi:hypothetical protein
MDPMTMMMLMQGGSSLLSGLFGNSGKPYEDAMKRYQEFGEKGEQAQNPFLKAGQGAIDPYQKWLSGMSNPSGFINNLMGQYQESPWAHNMQQQSMRAGQNFGSANGLSGSTPLAQQLQQNAGNISSQDMNQWLQNVLGINTQYGNGYNNLMGIGQNSANSLTGMYGDMGRQMGEAAYGRQTQRQQDRNNLFGGGMGLAGGIGNMFM